MRKISIILFFICVFFSVEELYSDGQQENAPKPAPSRPTMDFFGDAMSAMDSAFNDTEANPEDEYYLGRGVTANVLSAYKPYLAKPELTRYLNLICQTIVINSSRVEIFKGYYVLILDSPEFNAFASPGGHILLTRGLVDLATSEDMLAAIIAHELSHIMLKHGNRLINEMKIHNEIASVSQSAADLAGRNSAANRLMDYRNSVSGIVDAMVKNGYSREYEHEADLEAVKLLSTTGYDPGALRDILLRLVQVQQTQRGGFNTTHPSPSDRIANLEARSLLNRPQDTRSSRTQRFNEKR